MATSTANLAMVRVTARRSDLRSPRTDSPFRLALVTFAATESLRRENSTLQISPFSLSGTTGLRRAGSARNSHHCTEGYSCRCTGRTCKYLIAGCPEQPNLERTTRSDSPTHRPDPAGRLRPVVLVALPVPVALAGRSGS